MPVCKVLYSQCHNHLNRIPLNLISLTYSICCQNKQINTMNEVKVYCLDSAHNCGNSAKYPFPVDKCICRLIRNTNTEMQCMHVCLHSMLDSCYKIASSSLQEASSLGGEKCWDILSDVTHLQWWKEDGCLVFWVAMSDVNPLLLLYWGFVGCFK